MIEKNVKTKLDFDGREIYWSAKNNWKVKRFLVHMFSRNKTIERDSTAYSSGAKYWPPAKNCWADFLGRSDPHHMLNSMQDDRRAKMSQKIARNN